MALDVRIDPQHEDSLHNSVKQALVNAAWGVDLDAAVGILRNAMRGDLWLVGRGGSHVWLSRKTVYGPVRVAMIVERPGNWITANWS